MHIQTDNMQKEQEILYVMICVKYTLKNYDTFDRRRSQRIYTEMFMIIEKRKIFSENQKKSVTIIID